MQYIVLDMEWNQPWPGSSAAQRKLPMRGEIVQIGAVRLLEDGQVADEFSVLIRPKFYRHMNSRVKTLTGIRDSLLKREGLPFQEAIALFRDWCGEDCIFLIWGFDDIHVLQENLAMFSESAYWCSRWYNVQMIYNAQTDGSTAQKALSTAMAECGIAPSRPAHDALGDAYHTAVICSRLDLQRGMQEYGNAVKKHENGFHGAELPGCLERHVYHNYADKVAAFAAMSAEKNVCPTCGRQMQVKGRWHSQQSHRYAAMCACEEHGEFLVRIRFSPEEDKVRVSRLVYAPDSESAQNFEKLKEKKRKPRRRRSRRKKPAVRE